MFCSCQLSVDLLHSSSSTSTRGSGRMKWSSSALIPGSSRILSSRDFQAAYFVREDELPGHSL